jgi:hypothetical protein
MRRLQVKGERLKGKGERGKESQSLKSSRLDAALTKGCYALCVRYYGEVKGLK